MLTKTFIAAAAAATMAVTTAGLAAAVGDDRSPQAGGAVPKALAKGAIDHLTIDGGVTRCDGGQQKRVYNRINNQYSVFNEGADFDVPGMELSVRGPKRGKDTLSITFSGESQLRGSSETDYYDWMELEVLVNGTPIQPFGPPSSPLAFTGSREYASNAAQFCTRIGRGMHHIKVVTRLVDNGVDDTLTGWIDDTVLRVEHSQ